MGLLLQIIGVISLIVSLVYSIISISSGSFNSLAIVFLVSGSSLIRIGRSIYNSKK